jgi:GAF domain-containing protein/anti-sigma regulatory factor (Ser/Thr protein kinase)
MSNIDIDQRMDRLTRLQTVTSALSEAVTPAQVVDVVVEQGIAALGARAGLVSLLADDGENLEVVRTQGYSDRIVQDWPRFPLNASLPLSDVVREAKPLFIETRAEWAARYPEMVRVVGNTIRAAAAVPLCARGKVFGGLYFSFPEERTFSDSDHEFIDSLGRQCAAALERAQLYEDARRASEEAERRRERAEAAERRLGFVARASAVLAASLDYEETLAAVARLTVPDLADWAFVDVVSEDGATLMRVAAAHQDPEKVAWVREQQRLRPADLSERSGVPRVIRTGEAAFRPDLTDEMLAAGARDAGQLEAARSIGIRSVIIAPLSARGRTLGALTLLRTVESDRRFTEEDLSFASDIARRAGVAVDNARLYREAQREIQERLAAEQELRRQSAETHLLHETGRLIGQTLDLTAIYDTFRSMVSRAMDCVGMFVSELAQETSTIRCLYAWVEGERLDATTLPELPLGPAEGGGLQSQVIHSGESVRVDDFEQHRRAHIALYYPSGDGSVADAPDPSEPKTQSLLLVPVRLDGRVLGVIQVQSHRLAAYTADHLRLLEGMVLQVAAASRNAYLYNRTRQIALQQRRFLREMLFSLTEGRLCLCDSAADLPSRLPDACPPVTLAVSSVRRLRNNAESAAERLGFGLERMQDLETAVGEAGMNAVRHAGGGDGCVCADQGTVQVWIRDTGRGISEELLHRATLEKGFSTGGTLGHGFWMMLKTCDRLYLLTGPGGTTVVLEQERKAPLPAWLTAT